MQQSCLLDECFVLGVSLQQASVGGLAAHLCLSSCHARTPVCLVCPLLACCYWLARMLLYNRAARCCYPATHSQKYSDMERMWQQVADEARRESEAALQAAASRQQELNASRDELRHLQDRITELTALEANWRRRAEAAQQQVCACVCVWGGRAVAALFTATSAEW